MIKKAEIEDNYRYTLDRIWDESLPKVLWIMLNPSTADANEDDPTIRRCIGFANNWGFGGMRVVNIFAYRETDSKNLWLKQNQGIDINGSKNIAVILESIKNYHIVVGAWGISKKANLAAKYYFGNYDATNCHINVLGPEGQPFHPLYQPYSRILTSWNKNLY